MVSPSIRVHTEEVEAALGRMRRGLDGEIEEADNDAATMIADASRQAAYSLGGVAAKAAPGVSASGHTVSVGTDPWSAGAAFGGQGRATTMQFRPYLGERGYYLYPQVEEKEQQITETYENHLHDLIKRSGLA